MGYVDGTLPSPQATSPEFLPWYEKDQMILSWINATLSPSTLSYTMGLPSAKEAWDIPARRYGLISNSHVMNLRRQLHLIKKGSSSMQDYLHQFKLIVDQLSAAGSTISNDELLFAMLDVRSPASLQCRRRHYPLQGANYHSLS